MVNTRPGAGNFFLPSGQLFFISVLFFSPTLSPQLFGWLNGLLAVPVFYLLTVNGFKSGVIKLGMSLLLAGLGAMSVHRLEMFFFSLTLIPLGYSLFKSALTQESVAISGGKGVAVLSITWFLFMGVYGAIAGVHPYRSLLEVVDLGLQQSLEFYTSTEAGLPPEMIYNLQQATQVMREMIPKLLPGLLASALIITVWINMTACNMLINRFCKNDFPWGKYSTWKLPEQLVWVPIAAITLLLIGKGNLQYMGGWMLLVSSLLFFFQGLAILLAVLERFNVPVYVRGLLYFVLIIQSYGVLILTILGVSDIWINFRQKIEKR